MNKNLKKILIKTKKGVFGHHLGNNSSKFKGEGYDFVELREYEEGEDIRKIDWVISAKMQKPFVKVFQTQRELNISIISLLNGSVYFGTHKLKQELIAEICAILGFASVSQGDNFTSFIVNEEFKLCTKKTKKFFGVEVMSEKIYSYDCLSKKIDYKNLSNLIYKNIKERSIIFLLGDFLTTESVDLKLLAKKHEVIVLIIRDKFEEEPEQMGNVNLIDPSNLKTYEGNIDKSLINEYKKNILNIDQKLYSSLKKAGVTFIKIYTHENPLAKIMNLLK